MKIAFFDMDHTLLPIDTGDLWTRRLIEGLEGDRASFEKAAHDFHQGYLRGDFDVEAYMGFQMSLMAAFDRQTLDTIRDNFVRDVVLPKIPQAAFDLVNQAREQGYHPVLATGTHLYIATPIAPLFGMTDVIAAKPEEDNEGHFTGKLDGSHSYQEGKLRLCKAYLEGLTRQGQTIEELQAYSDSINDLSLLTFAAERGQTFAVNPDEALRGVAQREGWPVIELFTKENH